MIFAFHSMIVFRLFINFSVSVWDYRSSNPLAVLSTQPSPPRPSLYTSFHIPQSSFRSTLSPARVVRFSPSTSPHPGLLIFTDELSHLHVIDTLDLTEQLILDIPCDATGRKKTLEEREEDAAVGVAGRRLMVGTAGCGFSEDGRWMYAATEGSIGEWEILGVGGSGGEAVLA